MKRLGGRVAMVTGAAKRLGRTIALAMAREGADIVIHYSRSEAEARTLAEEIRALSREATLVQADLADVEAAREMFDRADRLAPVDLLVNNASIFEKSELADFTPGELERNVLVNAMAPMALMRALRVRGRECSVVNMLDSRITDTDPQHAAYALSKRMLFTMTRMAALEFAPLMRVNAVAPGLILPPPGEDEGFLERVAPGNNPLGRAGGAEAIADAVVYLASADFVTGQVLFVDGGRHVRTATYGGL